MKLYILILHYSLITCGEGLGFITHSLYSERWSLSSYLSLLSTGFSLTGWKAEVWCSPRMFCSPKPGVCPLPAPGTSFLGI